MDDLLEILIDPEDQWLIANYDWKIQENKRAGKSYATCRRGIYLHRKIMKAKPGEIVDHINGNGLDNRRANLRLCTAKQNRWNSRADRDSLTGLKGVTKAGKKLMAQIVCNGVKSYLGVFDSADCAFLAFRRAELHARKKFAGTARPD